MPKAASVQEIFENMASQFSADAAAGVDAVFQFSLSGDSGGSYWIKVADQKAQINQGEHESPTMTLSASADDFLALANGELNAMSAFMAGKIKVKGDMGLAMKLQSIFKIG